MMSTQFIIAHLTLVVTCRGFRVQSRAGDAVACNMEECSSLLVAGLDVGEICQVVTCRGCEFCGSPSPRREEAAVAGGRGQSAFSASPDDKLKTLKDSQVLDMVLHMHLVRCGVRTAWLSEMGKPLEVNVVDTVRRQLMAAHEGLTESVVTAADREMRPYTLVHRADNAEMINNELKRFGFNGDGKFYQGPMSQDHEVLGNLLGYDKDCTNWREYHELGGREIVWWSFYGVAGNVKENVYAYKCPERVIDQRTMQELVKHTKEMSLSHSMCWKKAGLGVKSRIEFVYGGYTDPVAFVVEDGEVVEGQDKLERIQALTKENGGNERAAAAVVCKKKFS